MAIFFRHWIRLDIQKFGRLSVVFIGISRDHSSGQNITEQKLQIKQILVGTNNFRQTLHKNMKSRYKLNL